MQAWIHDSQDLIPNVRWLEQMEVIDELRRKALDRAKEWQRRKMEMERMEMERKKRVLRVRLVRMEIRSVKEDGVARRIVMEMLRTWADTCKQEGTLLPWAHHTPLRNSYLHAEIRSVISDGHNGQFELHITHFRYFTAKITFVASLEAAAPSP